MENPTRESDELDGFIDKCDSSLSQEPTETNRDSCSIVAFEMQDYNNSNISEGPSLKVISLSDFIPTVCSDGTYQTVLVPEANSNVVKASQTVTQQSQILLLTSEPMLNSSSQDGLPDETIQEKVCQKYLGICRICANESLGLPLFHNQGLTFEIVEKIHRCLPIKVHSQCLHSVLK